MWTKAVELVERCRDEREAAEVLAGVALQDGYLYGRVLSATNLDPIRVQAFFDATGVADGWLPDGLNLRIVPPALAAKFQAA